MPKPGPADSQYNSMNGLYKACGYPTASSSEMLGWNNIDPSGVLYDTTASVFYAAGGVASVGLF